MRILVATASRHGSTEEIGGVIAEELRHAGHTVECLDVRDVQSIAGVDCVVLGSAIYFGKWLPEARTFIDRFAGELAEKSVWLFSSGPIGHEDPSSGPNTPPYDHLQDHHVFAGKLDNHSLSLPEKLVTRMIGATAGDFRNWDAIRAWARTIG